MEVLKSDKLDLYSNAFDNNQQMSILQALGADQDNSFFYAMQTTILTDNEFISKVDNIGQNASFTAKCNFTNAIFSMFSMGLVAKIADDNTNPIVFTGKALINALALFKGMYFKLGSVQLASTGTSDVYQQCCLSMLKQEIIDRIGSGVWYDPDTEKFSALAGTVAPRQANVLNYAIGNFIAMNQATNRVADKSFYVPLCLIFPDLFSIPDMVLYSHNNQSLEFSIQTQSAKFAFLTGGFDNSTSLATIGAAIAGDAAAQTPIINAILTQKWAIPFADPSALDYRIRDMGLLVQYTMLDAERTDAILKNQFPMQIIHYKDYPINIATSVMNAQFSVNKSERLKGLMFCFTSGDVNATVIAPQTGNAANSLGKTSVVSSKLLTFHKVKVNQIHINVGGQRLITLSDNGPYLQYLEDIGSHAANFPWRGKHLKGYAKELRHVYYIDLSRYPQLDFIGSSANDTHTLTVQLYIGAETISSFSTNAIVFGDLNCNFFLEHSVPIVLKNGRYLHLE